MIQLDLKIRLYPNDRLVVWISKLRDGSRFPELACLRNIIVNGGVENHDRRRMLPAFFPTFREIELITVRLRSEKWRLNEKLRVKVKSKRKYTGGGCAVSSRGRKSSPEWNKANDPCDRREAFSVELIRRARESRSGSIRCSSRGANRDHVRLVSSVIPAPTATTRWRWWPRPRSTIRDWSSGNRRPYINPPAPSTLSSFHTTYRPVFWS